MPAAVGEYKRAANITFTALCTPDGTGMEVTLMKQQIGRGCDVDCRVLRSFERRNGEVNILQEIILFHIGADTGGIEAEDRVVIIAAELLHR